MGVKKISFADGAVVVICYLLLVTYYLFLYNFFVILRG